MFKNMFLRPYLKINLGIDVSVYDTRSPLSVRAMQLMFWSRYGTITALSDQYYRSDRGRPTSDPLDPSLASLVRLVGGAAAGESI